MTKNERILLWYHEGIYPKFAIELVLYNKRNNEVFECKRLRDSILSAFFHSYIFAMYKNEALWI